MSELKDLRKEPPELSEYITPEALETCSSWIQKLSVAIFRMNVDKGFHEAPRSPGDAISLMHGELSEALEGFRDGNPPSNKVGEHGISQAEEEYADAIIRILDDAQDRGFNIGRAIAKKLEYNSKRGYKHGRQF